MNKIGFIVIFGMIDVRSRVDRSRDEGVVR